MTFIPLSVALIGTIALSGCSAIRSGKADGLALSDVKLDGRALIAQMAVAQSRFSVTTVDVVLSPSLRVSEANRFYPDADIVWRGEPMGDRLAQVQSILEEGLSVGTVGLNSGPPATLNVQLERFHALTEKARFSVWRCT